MIHNVIILCAKYLFVLPAVLCVWHLFKLDPNCRVAWIIRMGITGAIAFIFAKVSGAVYFDVRPFVIMHQAAWIKHVPDNGMPSDHTLVAMSATALLLPERRALAAVGLVATVLAGTSRVVCLLHSPLDISASILFGTIAGMIGYLLENRLKQSKTVRK